MFESVSRSFAIVRKSAGILMEEKKLLLFPLVSGIALVLVAASFLLPGLFVFGRTTSGGITYLFLFAFYLAAYFVILFFNSALVHAATNKIERKPVSLGASIRYVLSKLPGILAWAVMAATVGLILNIISRMAGRQRGIGGLVAGILVSIVGMAWSFATYFVIPVMIFENVGPLEAIQRSMGILKKTWGEKIVGGFGIGIVFFVLYLIGAGIFILGLVTPLGAGAIVLAVLYFIAVFLVQSTLQGIFLAALYKYAQSGQATLFASEELEGAFKTQQ